MLSDRPGRGSKHWLIDRQFREQLDRSIPSIRGAVVDVGCGQRPFEALIARNAGSYLGIDRDRRSADVVADVRYLPLPRASFDTALCFQVLDDVPEPAVLLAEIARVLRSGGRLLLSVNQSWREHNIPHDYFRFTRFGLAYLLGNAGFDVERIDPMGGLWAMLANRLAFWIDETLGERRWIPFTRAAVAAVLSAGVVLDRKNYHPEDTQNHFVVARKI